MQNLDAETIIAPTEAQIDLCEFIVHYQQALYDHLDILANIHVKITEDDALVVNSFVFMTDASQEDGYVDSLIEKCNGAFVLGGLQAILRSYDGEMVEHIFVHQSVIETVKMFVEANATCKCESKPYEH